jgi:Xaa-Pro aminopeptidase
LIDRLSNLRRRLVEQQLGAILITQPENRYYLSGFSGSAGYLLINAREAILATDFRYTEQASVQAPNYRIFKTTGTVAGWFPELTAGLESGRLGFETEGITFAQYRHLASIIREARPGIDFVPVDGLVEALRAVKGPGEIELLQKAAEITDHAFEQVNARIEAGMTELEAAWEIEKALRESGSEAIPFEVIVASGPNAALPHARPSDRRIQPGEPIVVDMGARVDGYCSDLSRTLCLNTQDATFKRVYDTVLAAQSAAINGIEEGMTGQEADRLARAVIEEAGYGESFGHSLGHGVGLAAHEEPVISPNSQDVLITGMVFTIEPGIYLPGWGGVRIEDLAVMDSEHARLLSTAGKIDTSGG